MATNIPKYTGEMPDLAAQGQEEISQNMTNFANYINALPTPLNTLADELTATNAIAAQQEANASKSAADALKYRNEAEVFAGLQNFKGDYLAGSYDIGDSVYYQGAYFINGIASNTNDPVSGGWSIIPKADFEPSVKPILDLDFANQEYSEWEAPTGKTSKPLADILDVTRGSKAGYTDPTGMTRTTSANTARLTYDSETGVSEGLLVEESRTNFIDYPQEAKPDDTLNGATAEKVFTDLPFGGLGYCHRLSFPNTTISEAIRWGSTIAGTPNAEYTGSIYIRLVSGATDGLRLEVNGQSEALTLSSSWSRYSTTQSNDNAWRFMDLQVLSGRGEIVVEVAYAQLEEGSFPTSIIPDATIFNSRASTGTYYDSTGTLQTAAVDEARYSYNPANLKAEPVLLLEEARTNLFAYSEDFSNAIWSKVGTTIGSNAINGLDGTLSADKVIEDTSTGVHSTRQDATVTIGSDYTVSFYLKPASTRRVGLILGVPSLSGAVTAIMDTDGSLVNGSTIQVTDVGNGWFRVSITKPSIEETTIRFDIRLLPSDSTNVFDTYTGDGGTGIHVWGAQLEQGSYPTSYIPTTTTQVTRAADLSTGVQATRAADSVVRDLSTLDGWNGKEFTVYVWYENVLSDTNGRVFELGYADNLSSNFLQCRLTTGGSQDLTVNSSYGTTTLVQNSANSGKIVVSVLEETVKVFYNGQLVETDVAQDFNWGLFDTFNLGAAVGSVRQGNSTFNEFKIYPRALSEAECLALTS
jgi:hypothetical protein